MKKIPILIVIAISFIVLFGIIFSFNNAQNSNDQATPTTAESNSMKDMYASISGDEFDKAFLADMLAHHQGALNMASLARAETTKNEIRTLSENILTSQTKEVQQMMDWQQQWGYLDGSNPHAGHAMEAGDGMGAAMAAMEAKLYDLTGDAYDKEFLAQMIVHHQQAIDMSRYAETNAGRQEIKDLARDIIRAQQKEIADMQRWQKDWGY